MVKILRMNLNNDPNLGLFGFATDKYFLVGRGLSTKRFRETLKTRIIESTISNTELVGIFAVGNSQCVLLPKIANENEIDEIKENINVMVLDTRYTALGNLVLLNDKGCLISKLIKKYKESIENFLGLRCEVSLMNPNVIGSLAIATNRGCLAYSNINEKDVKQIERVLDVRVERGTANFGSPFVGSCLIANSYGAIISEQTTGIEASRIEEIFFGE